MTKIMIGISSYLPDELYLRNIRKNLLNKQLKWLTDDFKNQNIFIISQNYKKNDYINYKNVSYVDISKYSISNSRNKLLNIFNNSNYDYLLLMDDDIFEKIYDFNFKILLLNFIKKFKDIDLISFIDHKSKNTKSHLKFFETYWICGALMLLKKQEKEYYFTESFLEDVEFGINLQLDNKKVFRLSPYYDIFRSGFDYSLHSKTIQEREIKTHEEVKHLSKKYNIEIKGNSSLLNKNNLYYEF